MPFTAPSIPAEVISALQSRVANVSHTALGTFGRRDSDGGIFARLEVYDTIGHSLGTSGLHISTRQGSQNTPGEADRLSGLQIRSGRPFIFDAPAHSTILL